MILSFGIRKCLPRIYYGIICDESSLASSYKGEFDRGKKCENRI